MYFRIKVKLPITTYNRIDYYTLILFYLSMVVIFKMNRENLETTFYLFYYIICIFKIFFLYFYKINQKMKTIFYQYVYIMKLQHYIVNLNTLI